MSGSAERFDGVIAAGEKSRADLAEKLAEKFRHDPKRFDPRNLERLGATGLRQFLEGIGETDAQTNLPDRHQRVRTRERQTKDRSKKSGWAHLQRPEWPVWISGVATGVRVGGMVTGSGLFTLFAAERVAPIVRGMLS